MASSKGVTYGEYVHLLSKEHRGLTSLSDVLNSEKPSSPSSVTTIDYPKRGEAAPPLISTCQEYEALVAVPPDCHGRIILVEDINASLIEQLGSELDIDPLFFASHIAPSPKGAIDKVYAATRARLPSQLVLRGHLHLPNKRVLDFGKIYAYENESHDRSFETATNLPRTVHLLPYSPGGKQLAVMSAYCSLTLKRRADSWICKF